MTDYIALQNDIAVYTVRTNDAQFITMIPTFIDLAQRRINNELKFLVNTDNLAFNLVQGQSVYDKPTGWRRTISVSYGTGTLQNTRNELSPRSIEYCRTYSPDPTITGLPLFYADYDQNHILVAPTPSGAYPAELRCYRDPQPLSASNTTNAYTTNTYDLLLYASLLETAPYLGKPDWITTWQQSYDRILGGYNNEATKQVVDATISRQAR